MTALGTILGFHVKTNYRGTEMCRCRQSVAEYRVDALREFGAELGHEYCCVRCVGKYRIEQTLMSAPVDRDTQVSVVFSYLQGNPPTMMQRKKCIAFMEGM